MSADLITWTTTHGDTVEVYESEVGDGTLARPLGPGWRYRVRAANNKIVETGSEGYTRKGAATRAALRHHPRVVHVKDAALPPDGGCPVCDECDGPEGHIYPHDCGHDR